MTMSEIYDKFLKGNMEPIDNLTGQFNLGTVTAPLSAVCKEWLSSFRFKFYRGYKRERWEGKDQRDIQAQSPTREDEVISAVTAYLLQFFRLALLS